MSSRRGFINAGGSAAGGSGTVTNTGGNLTANSVVIGAGTADTKVLAGFTTDGVDQLNLGAVGVGSGILGLNGTTSGTATITGPAVAGTATNPIVVSNNIAMPNSVPATPAISGAVGAGYGWGVTSAGENFWTRNGTSIAQASNIVFKIIGTSGYMSGSGDASQAMDTGMSRVGAAVYGFGNGTAGSEVGFWRSANGVRVTGDITLTVNTAIAIFSFALPAVAKAWGWQATIPWIISAGSGTNTLSIGVTYNQTPTGTTGMQGEILTTNTGTGTQAYVPLSATGATNLLTSGTITPGAGLFQASCSGTLLASATAGTFSITMTAAGTTATALAKAGATCIFY